MCRRDLILTGKYVYLIGREQIKKGTEKGKSVEVIKRKLSFNQISYVSLSTLQVIILWFYKLAVYQLGRILTVFFIPGQFRNSSRKGGLRQLVRISI